jgi:hypothetical protein
VGAAAHRSQSRQDNRVGWALNGLGCRLDRRSATAAGSSPAWPLRIVVEQRANRDQLVALRDTLNPQATEIVAGGVSVFEKRPGVFLDRTTRGAPQCALGPQALTERWQGSSGNRRKAAEPGTKFDSHTHNEAKGSPPRALAADRLGLDAR